MGFNKSSTLRKTMSRIFHLFARGVILLLLCAPVFGQAQSSRDASPRQKEVAVTIDDLPLNGPRIEIERLRATTGKLLDGIKRHRIPVVGFVNESLLYVPGETDARIAPLKAWADAGRSEEHTSELQSRQYLVCRLLLEKKKHTMDLK